MNSSFLNKINQLFRINRRKRVISRSEFRRARNYYPPEYSEKVVGFWNILSYCKEAVIPGDIVECGVGRGVSFFLLGLWANSLGLDKKLYGFDSFKGFPEPSSKDASFRHPRRGEWADTSTAHIHGHFEATGLTNFWSQYVNIVEGFFEETMPHMNIPNICFLHLDCEVKSWQSPELIRLKKALDVSEKI